VNDQDLVDTSGHWDGSKEKLLNSAKREVNNTGTVRFSNFSDLRIICQLLLDFFQSFSEPVIS
jgi:hypothetical protein